MRIAPCKADEDAVDVRNDAFNGWDSRWMDAEGVIHAVWLDGAVKYTAEVSCRTSDTPPFFLYLPAKFPRERNAVTCLVCIAKM